VNGWWEGAGFPAVFSRGEIDLPVNVHKGGLRTVHKRNP
jgi:hypothetical protein